MTLIGQDWQVKIGLMDQVSTDIKVQNLSQTQALEIRAEVTGKNASFARFDGGGGKLISVNRAHVAYVTVERMK